MTKREDVKASVYECTSCSFAATSDYIVGYWEGYNACADE
jgi:hypothetical protein